MTLALVIEHAWATATGICAIGAVLALIYAGAVNWLVWALEHFGYVIGGAGLLLIAHWLGTQILEAM